MPGPIAKLLKALQDRLSGARPGALRAFLVALGVGLTAAVATYRLLRSGE